MSVFSKTHFAYLDVKTQFKLNNVPASAIFDELQRTYEADIYVERKPLRFRYSQAGGPALWRVHTERLAGWDAAFRTETAVK